MKIRRLIYSDFGKYVISVLLGLGLSTFFRKTCNDRKCIVFNAKPVHVLKKKILKYNDKCYAFEESAQTCDSQKKTVSISD